MNCKQGDLAIFVRSTCGNEGLIVRCLSLTHHTHVRNPDGTREESAVWNTDRPVRAWDGSVWNKASDHNLRPIRNPGADETDEMVRLAGPAPMTLTELLREESNHG